MLWLGTKSGSVPFLFKNAHLLFPASYFPSPFFFTSGLIPFLNLHSYLWVSGTGKGNKEEEEKENRRNEEEESEAYEYRGAEEKRAEVSIMPGVLV